MVCVFFVGSVIGMEKAAAPQDEKTKTLDWGLIYKDMQALKENPAMNAYTLKLRLEQDKFMRSYLEQSDQDIYQDILYTFICLYNVNPIPYYMNEASKLNTQIDETIKQLKEKTDEPNKQIDALIDALTAQKKEMLDFLKKNAIKMKVADRLKIITEKGTKYTEDTEEGKMYQQQAEFLRTILSSIK